VRPEGENTLLLRAPAKINLYLEVLGSRPDGYHEIRTVMQTVSLFDELSFSLRDDAELLLRATGDGLPPPKDNLVIRAAELLRRRTGCRLGAEIRLSKAIPPGRGLGGGSSDCAATLLALNHLWRLNLPADELERLAAELGSDVPFFLRGGTALCEGRGERLSPVKVPSTFHYVLVLPATTVSTRQVYAACERRLTRKGGGVSMRRMVSALRSADVSLVGCGLYNALQAPAFLVNPKLRQIADALRGLSERLGAMGLSLTGSGSGFFLLVEDRVLARRAAGIIHAELGVSTTAVESLLESPWAHAEAQELRGEES